MNLSLRGIIDIGLSCRDMHVTQAWRSRVLHSPSQVLSSGMAKGPNQNQHGGIFGHLQGLLKDVLSFSTCLEGLGMQGESCWQPLCHHKG